MKTSRVRTIVAWIIAGVLAALFLLASLGKLTGAMTEMFGAWGYAPWFAYLIGVLELAGAVGLLIPRFSRFAILGLECIMLGAVYTHLVHDEGLRALVPVVYLVFLAVLWWLRRAPKTPVE